MGKKKKLPLWMRSGELQIAFRCRECGPELGPRGRINWGPSGPLKEAGGGFAPPGPPLILEGLRPSNTLRRFPDRLTDRLF